MKTPRPKLNKQKIITTLRQKKDYLNKEFGVKEIALFGSFARNEADRKSDIDILVKVKEKSFDNRFYLKEFLEKQFKRNVDLGYFDSVRPFIMRTIKKDLIYA